MGKCILSGGVPPFCVNNTHCCSASETKVGSQDGCVWWSNGLCKIIRDCGYSGVDVPVPWSPLSAGAGGKAVIARAGGALGCSSVCQQFLAFGLRPGFLKIRMNWWQSHSCQVKMECFPCLRYSVFQAVFRLRPAKCTQGSFLLPFWQKNSRLFSKWRMHWQVSEASYCCEILINNLLIGVSFSVFFLNTFSFFDFFLLNLSFSYSPGARALGDRKEKTPGPTTVGSSRAVPCLALPTAALLGPSGGMSGGHQLWGEA